MSYTPGPIWIGCLKSTKESNKAMSEREASIESTSASSAAMASMMSPNSRIAQVRVDLRLVAHAGRSQAEGVHRPLQIRGPVRAAQRQPLAQRRLVDLNQPDARRFEIDRLVADAQGDLQSGVAPRLIVADERPLQDRHRTGEHPLHRPRSERLRVLAPANRHRPRAGDVAEEDRRLDAQRPVALHPAVGRLCKALQLLAEILDHVGPLELAVDQHVQPDLFLKADCPLDLFFAEVFVAFERPLAGLQRGAGLADFAGLRERADGGRGEQRQREAASLGLAALDKRMPPAEHLLIDGGHPLPHRRIVQPRRSGAAFERGPARRQLLGHGRPAAVEAP